MNARMICIFQQKRNTMHAHMNRIIQSTVLSKTIIKQNEIARLSFLARVIKHSPTAHLNMLR